MKNKKWFSAALIITLYVILYAGIQIGIVNVYWEHIIKFTMINVILVVSLNLATGYLGQLTLSHAGFMAIGAYVSSLITKSINLIPLIEFPIALLIGGLVAMLFAFAISFSVLKKSGIYLVIISLAFNEVIRNIIMNMKLFGGANGYRAIPYYSNLTVVSTVLIVLIYSMSLLLKSKYGRVVVSIPQNETLAKICGINTFNYKLAAFCVSALFAGVAGGLFAHDVTVLEPNMFDYSYSLELLAMVIIGGLGNLNGSIISATVLTLLPYVFNFSSDYKIIMYLVCMILVIFFKPNGLVALMFEKIKFGGGQRDITQG